MNSAIEQMLKSYQVENIYDKENAMKEIIQEIVLCGLSRAGFFDKAAFYGVSDRPYIRPCGTVKGHLVSVKDFSHKRTGQDRCNSLPSVFRQNIHTNLPHIPAVRRAPGQSNQGVSIVCTDAKHVQLHAFLAQRIAPLR